MSLWISNRMRSDTISRYHLIPRDKEAYANAIKKISTVDLTLVDDPKVGSEVDLLRLFDKKTTNEDRQIEFSCAEAIIDSFEKASLGSDTVRMVLERQWPDFATFSIGVLTHAAILSNCDLNIPNIQYAGRNCQSIYGSIPKEIGYLLSLQNVADSNAKVLKLAQTAHSICFPKDK